MKITKKDMLKTLEVKKIILNSIFFLLFYLVISIPLLICLFNFIINPTLALILVTIFGLIFIMLEIYYLSRFYKLVFNYNKLESYEVKLDKIVWYMNDRIPVFSIKIGKDLTVETNAIYSKKNIFEYRNHKALVLYDKKKNRCYVVKTLD